MVNVGFDFALERKPLRVTARDSYTQNRTRLTLSNNLEEVAIELNHEQFEQLYHEVVSRRSHLAQRQAIAAEAKAVL